MTQIPSPALPKFTHPYPAAMPPEAYAMVAAEPLSNPKLAAWNETLAAELRLPASDAAWLRPLSGQGKEPLLATVYSGHQFGSYVPQLGDGRAASLGYWHGQELQLKGSGRTPYSRFGDGKAVWRSSIREYLASEALHGLHIPTTRALALVTGDDWVEREEMEHAAICTRVAPSFIRFGHFEYFFYTKQQGALRQLADYVITQHFSANAEMENRYAKLYYYALTRSCEMVARWMATGFCHGVMNTDNMSILGLTLDYGPYGFIETYKHDHICNHSDNTGRYAYDQQPRIMQWNLKQLAIAMSPLVSVEQLQTMLNMFPHYFTRAYMEQMRAKLGLTTLEDADAQLSADFLTMMEHAGTDYTQSFRLLSRFAMDGENEALATLFAPAAEEWNTWERHYKQRLFREHSMDATRQSAMLKANPALILRNHLAQEVIEQAESGNFAAIDDLRRLLANPFDTALDTHPASQPNPQKTAEICVSCSS
jgi:uncharacterized protein YdiU (UPF0061 family)